MRLILFLLRCLVGLFAAVGFLVVAGFVALALFVGRAEPLPWDKGPTEIPETTVLTLDLAAGVVEMRPENPLTRASLGPVLVLREGLEALDAAGRDDRVKGLLVRVGRGDIGFHEVQELRAAVQRFREQGKFAFAFAETFGRAGNGTLHYYLASAFDKVWLQPSGDVGVTGFSVESPFLREVLDDLGIEPRLDQREEYKGAMNTFTDSSLPDAQRRNLQRLVNSWLDQVSRGIAESRQMDSGAARGLIDRAPYLAKEALELGLVDELGYWDQAREAATAQAGADAEVLRLADYRNLLEAPEPEGPTIALIYGLGPVVLDRSQNDPVFGDLALGSDTVAKALSDAIEDEEVEAIVFRVDSPGGSYVASDVIWRQMQRARESEVPVIVSMGRVAASGGYFVAAPAQKIVAQPGTVTGSIGVVSGKLVLEGLWDKLGINWDGVRAGRNADIWSPNRDFTPQGWQRLQDALDQIYDDFTSKVAAGRGLTPEDTLKAAKGQVWTGEDAKELGLVDELGGLWRALVVAREAAGLDPDAEIRIKLLPERRDPFQAFLRENLGVEADSPMLRSLARSLQRLGRALRPLVESHELVTADPRSRTLMAPDLRPAR